MFRYRIHRESRKLAAGAINLRPGAVRRLTYEVPSLSFRVRIYLRRINGTQKIGVRFGNWLKPAGQAAH